MVPVEQQRLIFRGKVLKDVLALTDYPGLLDGGSTVHMVQRQGPAAESLSAPMNLISLTCFTPYIVFISENHLEDQE
jgi:hypothetical protein